MKIPKQEYTTEFRELAVKRVKGYLTVGAAAKELGLVEQTLRNWVKAAESGKLNGAGRNRSHPSKWSFLVCVPRTCVSSRSARF